jgi:hypothetical protein
VTERFTAVVRRGTARALRPGRGSTSCRPAAQSTPGVWATEAELPPFQPDAGYARVPAMRATRGRAGDRLARIDTRVNRARRFRRRRRRFGTPDHQRPRTGRGRSQRRPAPRNPRPQPAEPGPEIRPAPGGHLLWCGCGFATVSSLGRASESCRTTVWGARRSITAHRCGSASSSCHERRGGAGGRIRL